MHLFTPDKLKEQLSSWPLPGCYWIAFSGGMDSTALVHAMAHIQNELTADVRAIHINHGLHPDADSWQAHCEKQCKQLGIPLSCETVQVEQTARQSPEAQARKARYAAMIERMSGDDMLLTAHHAEDQAETVILNLMRGAGVDGLAAIQPLRRTGDTWLGRPLLHWRRQQLCQFLTRENITFVDDPSNDDLAIRRNYVRHEILPRLTRMWPAATEQLNKSAELVRSASSILKSVAAADLAICQGARCYEINVQSLYEFDIDRQALIVRQWARANDLPTPDQRQLIELLRQLHHARDDTALCLKWPGVELHRYRAKLFIMPAMPECPGDWQLEWDGHTPVDLPAGSGKIFLQGGTTTLFDETPLLLHTRIGSERLQPAGQPHHKSLKQLFQSAGIPPWLRSRIPLVSQNGQCLAVGDIWLDQDFEKILSKSRLSLFWEPGLQQLSDIHKDMLAAE